MSYTTQQDILDFVEDNNVKFVRFAFCDIFGFQKNIAVLASDLPKALEDGVCFDGSAIAGFMHVEESDLLLRPDLSTMTILPWRTAEGRVMQFFCDVEKPHSQPSASEPIKEETIPIRSTPLKCRAAFMVSCFATLLNCNSERL